MSRDVPLSERLILQIRLETLIRNLENVQNVQTAIVRYREEITNLHDKLNEMSQRLEQLQSSLSYVGTGLERNLARAKEDLEEATVHGEDIGTLIVGAAKLLDGIDGRLVQITENIRQRVSDGFEGDLVYDEQRKLEAQLGKLAVAEDNGPVTEDLEGAWSSYWEVYRRLQDRVFPEYLDLVGGLALRDTGYDEGICAMGDELVENLRLGMQQASARHSLTLPTRDDPLAMTLARIIRLGFPEWSIWTVPVAARAFGYVMVAENNALQQWIENRGADHLETYLVDAFATNAMGPAYAHAVVLLRLDPRRSESEGPVAPDTHRAYVILKSLERVDEASTAVRPYRAIAADLRAYWQAAVRHVGGPEELPEDVSATLDDVVAEMFDLIKSRYAMLTYDANRWDAQVIPLKDTLARLAQAVVDRTAAGVVADEEDVLDDEEVLDGDEGFLEAGGDIRDVFNAAWQCRLEGRASLLPGIEKATSKVWRDLHRQPSGGRSAGRRQGEVDLRQGSAEPARRERR